jgi:hypothetical protein
MGITLTQDDTSSDAQPTTPLMQHEQTAAAAGVSEHASAQVPAPAEESSTQVKPIILDVLLPSLVVLFRWGL